MPNVPAPLHTTEAVLLAVASFITIVGTVQTVVSFAVTFGGGITVTFIVVEVFAQGELAFPVRVRVTEPVVILGVYVLATIDVLLNEPDGALHATDAALLSVALAITMEDVVAQMVVSTAVTTGAGTTVTFMVAEVFAQGELALPVRVRVMIPDVIVGGV